MARRSYIYIYNSEVSIIDRQIIIGLFFSDSSWVEVGVSCYIPLGMLAFDAISKNWKRNNIYVSNKTWLQVLVHIFCLANFFLSMLGEWGDMKILFWGIIYIYYAQKFLGVSWDYILDKINWNLHLSSYLDIMKLGFWCEGLTCTFLNINL